MSIIWKTIAFDPFFKARLDPEFFQKHYLLMYSKIISNKHELLAKIAFVTDGEHGNAVTSHEGYSKYFGARNVLTGILNDNTVEFITKAHHDQLKKTSLKPRDLLISCVGANIGFASIVPDNVGIGNIVRNVALIRSISEFSNEFLLSYFLCSFGKNLYIRMNSGNAQPLVSLDYINTIPIPKLSKEFQSRISVIVSKAISNYEQSILVYNQAENLLFKNIGLKDFKPSSKAVNVKSFNDSFGVSGRLDAEYYQVKYEDYISLVKNYTNGWQPLNATCNVKDDNFNPHEKTEYNYIELSDIGKTGDITGCTTAYGSELPSRARRVMNTGDVVISSIEGSLGSCAIVQTEYNNALCSTGFYVINSSKLNAATLLVLFKSEVMQNILKQGCSGTILTAINKNEFLNIPIPLIEQYIQNQISDLINDSFLLKNQSEHLLEVAKKAVEMAIEEGEERAMEWINKNI